MSLTPGILASVARRFAALADENRLKLLDRLRQAPANVTTLARDTCIAQPSVTKHLAQLREVGLVDVRREGSQAVYRIVDDSVFALCEIVCEGVRRHARVRHAELAAVITETPTEIP